MEKSVLHSLKAASSETKIAANNNKVVRLKVKSSLGNT